MSDHLIPPGVGATDAALLRRAYALTNQAELQALYNEWAATYDTTMLDGLGYVSPQRLVERFAAVCPWRNGAVLDIGAGTGLVGSALRNAGFTTIDATSIAISRKVTSPSL
jgi:predicted TPR repeat methyltransferase